MELILFIYLAISCHAQRCTVLTENTICGSVYSGFPILNDTEEVFNSKLLGAVANSTFVAETLTSSDICQESLVLSEVQKLRYQVSVQCSKSVTAAIKTGCKFDKSSSQPNGPVLCQTECIIAANSVETLAANSRICPNGSKIALEAFTSHCESLSNELSNNRDSCVVGTSSESTYCGFSDETVAKEQCKILENDACCQSLVKEYSSSGPSQNTAAVIITIAAVVFILLLAVLIGVYYKYSQKSKQDTYFARSSTLKLHTDDYASPRHTSLYMKSPQLSPPIHYTREKVEVTAAAISPADAALLDNPPLSEKNDLIFPPALKEIDPKKSFLIPPAEPADDEEIPETMVSKEEPEAMEPILFSEMPLGTKQLTVIHPYESSLNDELQLVPGSIIFMLRLFDDGWALGVDPLSRKQGAFPVVCTKDAVEAAQGSVEIESNYDIGNRNSSMIHLSFLQKRISSVVSKRERIPVENAEDISNYIDELEKFEQE